MNKKRILSETKGLEEKFQYQLKELVTPTLSRKEIIRNYILITLGIIGVIVCITSSLYVGLTSTLPQKLKMIIISPAIFVALFMSAYVYHIFIELKKRKSHPRMYMKINLLIHAGFVFILYFFYAKYALNGSMKNQEIIYYGISILFFWILAMTFVLWQTNTWNKEEILLQQKCTQLEIMKLREEFKELVKK